MTQRDIEHDCQRALIRFYDGLDERDYHGMLALCTPDCIWHRAGKTLSGQAAILAELRKRSETQTVRHVLTNMQVKVQDAGRAALKCLLTAYRHDNGVKSTSAPLIQKPILLIVITADFVNNGLQWLIAHQVMKDAFLFEERL